MGDFDWKRHAEYELAVTVGGQVAIDLANGKSVETILEGLVEDFSDVHGKLMVNANIIRLGFSAGRTLFQLDGLGVLAAR